MGRFPGDRISVYTLHVGPNTIPERSLGTSVTDTFAGSRPSRVLLPELSDT